MKYLILIFLLFSGCMTKSFKNSKINPSPDYSELSFETLDLNEDGNISKTEVKNFSEKAIIDSSKPEVSAPIWATIGIVVLTLIMCLLSAIIKCNKSE